MGIIVEQDWHNCLSVAIQAGGNSTRMGRNKALIPFLGEPLIERVLQRVSPIATEIFVVSNETYAFKHLKVQVLQDDIEGMGAIGGLYTAMLHAACKFVAVVACDMPFLNIDILRAGLNLLIETGADVAIPKMANDYYEPLHAVYRKDSCKQGILDALQHNRRRLISWLSSVAVIELNESLCKTYDPMGLAFINTNTEEEFKRAEKIAAGLM